MKRKLSILILALVTVICCAFGLAACDDIIANIGNGGSGSNTEQGGGNGSDTNTEQGGSNNGGNTNTEQGTVGLEYALSGYGKDKYYMFCGIGNCTDTEIVIPDFYKGKPVKTICDGAFNECSGLTSVTIGNNVTEISYGVFNKCSGLESITVGSGNTVYHSAGNCLIETQSKILIAGFKNSVIPTDGSVTTIGGNAFYSCEGLASIAIPNSVTTIGREAFGNCNGLTSVTIPDSVTEIGREAFENCSGLTSVTIGNGVTAIDEDVFAWCSGLTSITIGNSVTEISFGAFRGCDVLEDVSLPTIAIEYIPKNNLKTVIITSGNEIGDYAFDGCTRLKSVTIPDSIISISYRAINRERDTRKTPKITQKSLQMIV